MNCSRFVNQIKNHTLFNGIDEKEIRALISDEKTEVKQFTSGDLIFSPENDEKKLGFVISGNAYVNSVDSTNSVLIKMLSKNDVFGLATLFGSRKRFVSVISAKNACKVVFVDKEPIEKLMNENKTFQENYIRVLSDRICFLNSKISAFTAGSPERKLAYFLCTQSPEDTFILGINYVALSDMLNVGRASLYRAFDKLEEDGFLIKDGKKITLLDRYAMIEKYE